MTPKDDILTLNSLRFSSLNFSADHHPGRLFPRCGDSSEISIGCYRGDYSASRIARAVEDCDAHLLNLNITGDTTEDGRIVVDVRISHRNAAAVCRSLERYGYDVLAVRQEETASDLRDETAAERIGELMAHLNI